MREVGTYKVVILTILTRVIDDLPRHAHVAFQGAVEVGLEAQDIVFRVYQPPHCRHRLVLNYGVVDARILET